MVPMPIGFLYCHYSELIRFRLVGDQYCRQKNWGVKLKVKTNLVYLD